jgi:hypothetical protein
MYLRRKTSSMQETYRDGAMFSMDVGSSYRLEGFAPGNWTELPPAREACILETCGSMDYPSFAREVNPVNPWI